MAPATPAAAAPTASAGVAALRATFWTVPIAPLLLGVVFVLAAVERLVPPLLEAAVLRLRWEPAGFVFVWPRDEAFERDRLAAAFVERLFGLLREFAVAILVLLQSGSPPPVAPHTQSRAR